ncbi:C39 family peptidase [Vagococcus fluvialis]|uniref:C39 family peptidase n=1 Tax=Vagococcus fluvialis TaxID=2738 RepID=UPI003BF26FAA
MKKRKLIQISLLTSLLAGFLVAPINSVAEVVTSSNSRDVETIDSIDENETRTSISSIEEIQTSESSSSEEIIQSTVESVVENNNSDELVEKKSVKEEKINLKYSAHVQNIGWQDFVNNGEMAGTVGRNLAVEGMKINLENVNLKGNIEYKAHVQDIGWQDWVKNGEVAGTVGRNLPSEAYQIRLTEELAENYDIYYRIHATNVGWLDWAKNGEAAGTEGFAYKIQAIEIRILEKGEKAPGSMSRPYVKKASIDYQTYVNGAGWQDWKKDGKTSGTTGKDKGIEGLKVNIQDLTSNGSVEYKSHVAGFGWQDWVSDSATSGDPGKDLSIEAVQIRLTGELAQTYNIFYRVHSSNVGWLDWAKNGQSAGTQGMAFKIEAVEIKLVPKYDPINLSTKKPFIKRENVIYETHVKNKGWQLPVRDTQVSGTTGQNLWVEGLKLKVENQQTPGSIQYRSHVREIGWQNWVSDYQLAGTVGRALPTEAFQIKLTGDLAKYYDIYYRVHSQNLGWLGWARNGQSAGSAGYAYHIEAVEIQLNPKGAVPPGPLGNSFVERKTSNVITSIPYVSQYTPVFAPWGCASAAMTMPLRSKGVNVDLKYAQDHLPMYPAHPGGQKGNVYTGEGFGWVIKPYALVEYMKNWYPYVYDISGSDTTRLKNEVLDGNPVMFYGYSSYQVDSDKNRNHVKVIAGYKDGKFLVYDPLYYSANDGAGTGGKHMKYDRGAKHWISVSDFNKEYNGQAILIK